MDTKLAKIKSLKWHPYIGNKYNTSQERLLIAGESHYKKSEGQAFESSEFTRNVFRSLALQSNDRALITFSNLYKSITSSSYKNDNELYSKVSFFNLIQRPMETNKSWPNVIDYKEGLITFFRTISILKPTHFIFISTTAAQFFRKACETSDFTLSDFTKLDMVNKTYPKKFKLKKSNVINMKGLFIKHTSQFYSTNKLNLIINETFILLILHYYAKQITMAISQGYLHYFKTNFPTFI